MKIKKPAWMVYAANTQKQLDDIKPSKGGKREEEHLYRTWLTAKQEHGYAGSEYDWQILIRRIGRGES